MSRTKKPMELIQIGRYGTPGTYWKKGFDQMLDAKLLKSDLIYLLVLVDKQLMSEAPGATWERYYADFFVSRYIK